LLREYLMRFTFGNGLARITAREKLLPKLKAEVALNDLQLARLESRMAEIRRQIAQKENKEAKPKALPKRMQDDNGNGNCKCPECGHEAPCEDFRNTDQASTTSAYYLRRMQGLRK